MTITLNKLIESHECHKIQVDEQLRLINSWSTLVPNSFLRALNGLINGEPNLDILPGEYLNNVISSYPVFSGPIFVEHPTLPIQSARTKLITIYRNPLIIERVIIVPKILSKPFGKRYVMHSCGWTARTEQHTPPMKEKI